MSNSSTLLNSTITSLASSGPPAWLFTDNERSTPSTQVAVTPDTMAKKDKKAQKASKPPSDAVAKPAALPSSPAQKPPTQLMDLVESFLSDQGFEDAHREFRKHRATKSWMGHDAGTHGDKDQDSLVSIFQTWESLPNSGKRVPKISGSRVHVSVPSESSSSDESSDGDDVAMADAPAAELSSDESSSEESSSSDDSSSSESDSDSDEEEATTITPPTSNITPTPVAKSLKRKAKSDEDEDMTSSEDKGKPQSKKPKTQDSSDDSLSSESSSDSSSDSSSESESDSEDEKAKPKMIKTIEKPQSDSDNSSESDSDDSSSSSESESDSEDELEVAAKVALPESDSESDSEPETKTGSKAVTGAVSDSSATLEKASPESAPLPPNPTTFKANNRGKNGPNSRKPQNQPFSRISKDITVDPRLSSNAYVTHGYGEQAHRDLIVTKGKGFTKEKNKKKRGSYKGGPLDVHTSRSFKFEN
ncbi:hypothetical protein F4824DRAFT_470949 [Ustulina deusta]|nr:hypothetical protein F4823DRAFT_603120 [Ustulina deusta]KAI3333832.1 hypothetical protein F4824DRAFT_470949 [Ustulina deusta]